MSLRPRWGSTQVGFGSDIPEAFGSLEEARNSLDYQSNCITTFLKAYQEGQCQSEQEAEESRLFHQTVLQRWEIAFERLLANPDIKLDTKSQQGALVLKVSHRLGAMHLEFSRLRTLMDESVWDTFTPQAEEIIGFAEAVVALEPSISTVKRPTFSVDFSIVGALFAVAHKCRDPYLRRRAIAVLRTAPRQEGVWDSINAAHVAERIMTIEESGLEKVECCQDVPASARISEVSVSFDPVKRQASFTCSRYLSKLGMAREYGTR